MFCVSCLQNVASFNVSQLCREVPSMSSCICIMALSFHVLVICYLESSRVFKMNMYCLLHSTVLFCRNCAFLAFCCMVNVQ